MEKPKQRWLNTQNETPLVRQVVIVGYYYGGHYAH